MSKEKPKSSRSYRRYDPQFKSEVLKQLSHGKSVKELSEKLGISEGVLYRWRSKSQSDTIKLSSELKRLRKQVKDLEKDNEVLKKALRIFSQSDQ